jgi:palmitoyl-protein thioesterase
MFNNDSVTEPKITQHFGYYKNGSKNILLGLNKTNDYVNDILGLKTLNELGKVFLESVEGDHLQLTSADIQRTVIPYLF